jgi:uncharacterized protein
MDETYLKTYTAFHGDRCLCSGDLIQVTTKVKEVIDRGESETLIIFDDLNGEIIEVDLRGAINDVLQRIEKITTKGNPLEAAADKDPNAPRGPGRPKLGVISTEVTLLPRHWDWLNRQPGGASVALRKLVDKARHDNIGKDRVRHSQEAAYRFMSAMAGNLPGYEEALRALFSGNREHFDDSITSWPVDIQEYALKLSNVALHGKELTEVI